MQQPVPSLHSMLVQATELCVKLRQFQASLPQGDRRKEAANLAHILDCWCRAVEDGYYDQSDETAIA